MAEGYLRHFAGNQCKIYSAGIETHGLNPRAVKVMAEDGIDISGHSSNNVAEYHDINFDFIITVCDQAKENCPYIPGEGLRFHKNFHDPAKARGTDQEVLNEFRLVRNLIKSYSAEFIKEELRF